CYHAAISACAKGHSWRSSLASLREMRELGLSEGLVGLNAAMTACEKGRTSWHWALQLASSLRSRSLALDRSSFGALLTAVERASC
ncbi:unnamed protein product, partial [Polarella glacialis]